MFNRQERDLVVEMEIAVFVLLMVFVKIQALESTEDDSYTNPYNSLVPSTSNFQDIYSNTFNRNNEESTLNDDEFTIPNNQIQSAEFHPGVLKISGITPAPKILFSASLRKKNDASSTDNTIVDDPEPIQVLPLRNTQRGVLDVLFPPTRVKSFKSVFDSVRRILSYTFRKR